jgi:hypothetical protein
VADIEKLDLIIKNIETFPKQHMQWDWGRKSECGTAFCVAVFSPGFSGPTIPESSGPTVRDRLPCVDGRSSSSWPHRSQGLEQPYVGQWSPTSPQPGHRPRDVALPPATPWCSDSVASRSKTGAAALWCRAARTGGPMTTLRDIDACVEPEVSGFEVVGPEIDGDVGPKRVGENNTARKQVQDQTAAIAREILREPQP